MRVLSPLCVLLLAFLGLDLGAAYGSPVALFGFGTRSHALLSANLADTKGAEAVYLNPSGLAFEKRPSFSLGYQYGNFDLQIDGQKQDVLDASAIQIGFGVPLPLGGFLKERLSLGMGFVIPQNSVLVADIKKPGVPTFSVLENRAQTVSIQAALGVKITDWLALGVGTLALAELTGSVKVRPNPSGELGSQVEDQLLANFALVAGLTLRLLEDEEGLSRLKLGFSYRGESRADFKLPIEADLGEGMALPLPELTVKGTAQYDPQKFMLGGTYHLPTGPFLLSLHAQVAYELWSSYPTPITYAASRESTPPQPKPDFKDVFSASLALEEAFPLDADWTLHARLAAGYRQTPVKEQVGMRNDLDADRWQAALGLELEWRMLRLALAFQYQHSQKRTHVKGDDASPTWEVRERIQHEGDLWFFSSELGVSL